VLEARLHPGRTRPGKMVIARDLEKGHSSQLLGRMVRRSCGNRAACMRFVDLFIRLCQGGKDCRLPRPGEQAGFPPWHIAKYRYNRTPTRWETTGSAKNPHPVLPVVPTTSAAPLIPIPPIRQTLTIPQPQAHGRGPFSAKREVGFCRYFWMKRFYRAWLLGIDQKA